MSLYRPETKMKVVTLNIPGKTTVTSKNRCDLERTPKWVKRNREIGNLGEYIAELYLQKSKRLDNVYLVAEDSDDCGYDILAFLYGKEVFYEVKTTTISPGNSIDFFITQNELSFAEAKGDAYAVFYIQIDEKKNEATGRIIHNIFSKIGPFLPIHGKISDEVSVLTEQYRITLHITDEYSPINLSDEMAAILFKVKTLIDSGVKVGADVN